MTPSPVFNTDGPVRSTGDLIRFITSDTRHQLREWTTLSLFLRCTFMIAPDSRAEAATLCGEAVAVLREMLRCAEAAERLFRKHRLDPCLRVLHRFDDLRRTLNSIDRDAARTVFGSFVERSGHGRRG